MNRITNVSQDSRSVNTTSLQEWAIADWLASGIDSQLIQWNLRTYDGWAAYEQLLYSSDLPRVAGGTKISPSMLSKYRHLNRGGWWCGSLDPATEWKSITEWGCFKPLEPRLNKEGKTLKYEHPPSEPTQVFYLQVPSAIWDKIANQYGIARTGDNFWQWVKAHPQIPIFFTEGAKKAAALLSRGYVAIALPGVSNFAKRDRLKDCITAIGLKNRECIITHDYEPKKITRINVGRAAGKFAKLLRDKGANPSFLRIPPAKNDGKQGIDDYFVSTNDNDLKGCEISSESLYPVDEWSLTTQPNIELNQRYLGNISLPDSGLVVVKSPTGTGKTDSIAPLVQDYAYSGRRVLAVTNRISTGRELANRFGVPYVDEHSESTAMGFALCIESVKPFGKAGIKVTRVHEGDELPSEWLNDCVVVLDEFDQTLAQMLGGNTCRGDRGWILSTFKGLVQDVLCRSNGLVIALSADISDIDVEFLMAIAREGGKEVTPFVVVNNYRPAHKYDAFLYKSQAEVYLQAVQILQSKPDDKCLFFSTEGQKAKSTWGTQTIEKMLAKNCPGTRILRIDRETLSDPSHPAYGAIERLNELAREYDVFLASPSISSAVSLNENGRWVAVCDISAGLASVPEYRQRLDRVREGVPRHLYIPTRTKSLVNGASNYKKVAAGKNRQFECLMSLLRNSDFNLDHAVDPICLRTWAKQIARFNRDSYGYKQAATDLLESEGVSIISDTDKEVPDTDTQQCVKTIKDTAKVTRDEQWEAHCLERAEAETLSPEDFEIVTKKKSPTREERLACEKYKIQQDFGIDPTPELIKKHDEGVVARWRLHFYLLFGKFAEHQDRNNLEAQTKKPLLHAPDIRSRSIKAKLLHLLGIDKLLQPDQEFSAESPEIQRVALLARSDCSTLKDVLGVGVSASTSAVQTVQQLLSKLDLKLSLSSRRRVNGKITRFYKFEPPKDERWEIFDSWADQAAKKLACATPCI